jgi:hypothetical protein
MEDGRDVDHPFVVLDGDSRLPNEDVVRVRHWDKITATQFYPKWLERHFADSSFYLVTHWANIRVTFGRSKEFLQTNR